ncbi:phosphoribosylformylglycinamidine synthase [Fusibacter ferrireducens]|uniref:Phosphoribosylformylglycinamidine synthase n=1 Tax=Fusibacter ferrireducens TaxID=2785058 RepID=A0ABR9ZVZ0_9FIRM|nr:phosphoribosylformylglycinamidine synthase [Fusibacter ferrireducens]MBF4694622.1 phosphoribosylformylglycinamidine synthase [Fusibacter ferrireducens]
MSLVKRILVQKKTGFDVEAHEILHDLKQTLHIHTLEKVSIINVYDMEGVNESKLSEIKALILSEPNVDNVTETEIELPQNSKAFRIELLPGQYDQRADSAAQCIEIVTLEKRPEIVTSRIIVIEGAVSEPEFEMIKTYLINPVESREVPLEIPETVKMVTQEPHAVKTVENFIDMSPEELVAFKSTMGFAMTVEDVAFIQTYFKETEHRNPTITELRVIDTYWSDHCRHTTFSTEIEAVEFEESDFKPVLNKAFEAYLEARKYVYADRKRDITLMDLATINMKTLRKEGGLEDLDVSDEINACSIEVDVKIDGKKEPWLLMFKNETHNHPTEIEPFGGAATCLGGAIRDPLSGRSYVYHSMRVTGAADPTVPFESTLEGKLPQKIITQKAAAGFSAYGNQIGLATGHVAEVYDEGFLAKRMEVGAVVGAAPKANIVREKPLEGDVILLVGGRTGRDGIGGATGSSKEHDEESLLTCGAEVQKGNPPVERKIQRLFRNPNLSKLIKKCNDFGAGGVSVAIGELADSLQINLDAVKKKYEGLDGTELAISESQERMAVVIAPENVADFMAHCDHENLEVSEVAKVTDDGRLIMTWNGQEVLNLSRAFLDTNGVKGKTSVKVSAPSSNTFFNQDKLGTNNKTVDLEAKWLETVKDLNNCSQKGLVERFDNTIGAGTVLMPFGGKTYNTPAQTMVAKFPVLTGETDTVSMMAYGYDPAIGKWSPFHGGLYAVVDSIAKLVATGGAYEKVRLSLQEYFEKLGNDPVKWGKPFSALLGASYAQSQMGTAAIGGKDSMSGTFKDINVPPTLISFAVNTAEGSEIISPEFKAGGNAIGYFYAERDASEIIDFENLKKAYSEIHQAILEGQILSAYAVGKGGVALAMTKMAFGNKIGFTLDTEFDLFEAAYGSLVFEIKAGVELSQLSFAKMIGKTTENSNISVNGVALDMDVLMSEWEKPLDAIFPKVHEAQAQGTCETITCLDRSIYAPKAQFAKPRVLVPAFPGTNCEWDTQRAFEKAGAVAEPFLFRNLTPEATMASIDELVEKINKSQILAIPGGFSAGDEPEGSGKFIASVFRNPRVAEALMKLLNERDGLVIGICNGFQALVKLGLLPYGEIKTLDENAPTLTFNKIGRHVARMAHVRVASVKSPWFANVEAGDVFETAFSHGEGRFYADDKTLESLKKNGQIATQYVDSNHQATYDGHYNINGSVMAIEGITSVDGRILGKMGHVERVGKHLYKNIYGASDMKIFEAGVNYFKL